MVRDFKRDHAVDISSPGLFNGLRSFLKHQACTVRLEPPFKAERERERERQRQRQ